MSTMTKKRVAELEGAQLDWAVVVAAGKTPRKYGHGVQFHNPDHDPDLGEPWLHARPSTDWAQGGPIIERERIDIEWWENVTDGVIVWDAVISLTTHQLRLDGQTPLIAAMRAFVASKLGDEVEVPE